MPKRLLTEARFDWRGGLNTLVNPDNLNVDELTVATNVRLTVPHGALAKRTGTRRMHAAAITGGVIRGLIQWDAPAGKEIVAVTNTHFAHKTTEFGAFTEVLLPAVAGAGPVLFMPFRDTTALGTIVLYFATFSGLLYKWDGTTLTNITAVSGAPQAVLLKAYHTRAFAVDERFLKQLQWSDLGSATLWDGVGPTGGGSAIVDLLVGEGVTALEVVGRSLLVGTEESVIRLTGYSNEDVRIEQDTEGISVNAGPVGALAMRRFEKLVAMVTDRGVYAINEEEAQPLSAKIEPEFDDLVRATLANSVVQYHRGRRELWVAVREFGQANNQSAFVYAARTQGWTKFDYSATPAAGITDMARFEDANGDEFLMASFTDGFVRHMDIGALDNVDSAGVGGTNITFTARLAPIFFETGPAMQKSLQTMMLRVDRPAASAVVVKHRFDNAAFVSETALVGGTAGEIDTVRVDLDNEGNRLDIEFVDASADIPIIHGFQLFAHDMQRMQA